MVKVKENDKDNNPDGPAAVKRVKTNNVKQQTMFIILIASVVVGVCLVLSVYFVKVIRFNSDVIDEKNGAINSYVAAINQSGACLPSVDSNKDGELSVKELKSCDPESIDAQSVPSSLRYNVMVTLANDYNLETVARDATSVCYDDKGKKYNFQELYDDVSVGATVNDIYVADLEQANKLRTQYLSLLKMCSSLRVISEAMPTSENIEALMSSLNELFLEAGYEPEGLSPSQSTTYKTNSKILNVIPVNLSIKENAIITRAVLANIEKSIRPFNVYSGNMRWNDDVGSLELSANTVSYYTDPIQISESTKVVKANSKK